MSIVVTENQYRVCRQPIRNEYARITILNNKNLEIGQIQGKLIDGTVTVDNSSYLRRSCQISLVLDNTLLPGQQGYIWTSNMFKLEVGIGDILNNDIEWFSQGIYVYKNAQITYDVKTSQLQINGLDKMALFSGDISGTFQNDMIITYQGTPISDAIKAIVELGGETNYRIDEIVDSSGNILTVPMNINIKAGSSMLDALKQLISLYMYQDFYYDVNGTFICTHTATLLSDAVSQDFSQLDLSVQYQVTDSYDYIKNHVQVYGVAVQPMLAVQDEASTTNPNPINNGTSLRITFNKPLYDNNGNMITDQANVKSYFTYNGTSVNFVSAIYSASTWQITFTINGENGKTISPIPNNIFDDTQMALVPGNCTFIYSTTDTYWSGMLCGTVILNGVNDTTQFELDFNKPLYNASGVAIASGTSLISSFTYSDGTSNSNNFLSAVYTVDTDDYYITLTFAQPTPYMTVEINNGGTNNTNSIYDSSKTIYQPASYIMSDEWTTNVDPNNPSSQTIYQISYELKNTDNTSPYSIDNIGDRLLVVNDTNIYNTQQAELRAEYELQQHSNMNESIVLNCLNLYYLDVNCLINLKRPEINVSGKYRIDKISFPLSPSSASQGQITCVKVYM